MINASVILHQNLLDILFCHKEEVYRQLINIKGVFFIDHIAIKIIDPNNQMMIFSLTPSVEYNLILQDLWQLDKSFSLHFNKQHAFYSWHDAYSGPNAATIKEIKETKHGFTFGFNITKQINQFMLIYSFATRTANNHLAEYYQNHRQELSRLGDYGYKLIRNLYAIYRQDAPKEIAKKPFLQLIVNNI